MFGALCKGLPGEERSRGKSICLLFRGASPCGGVRGIMLVMILSAKVLTQATQVSILE